MSERTQRKRVVKALRAWDAIAVENSALPGTPDVEYIGGWLELKQVASWPKREDVILQVRHFTPQQRVWLTRRWRRGGAAHLLLQVRREWLLFDGPTAARLVGRATRRELLEAALYVSRDGFKDHELRQNLKRYIPKEVEP